MRATATEFVVRGLWEGSGTWQNPAEILYIHLYGVYIHLYGRYSVLISQIDLQVLCTGPLGNLVSASSAHSAHTALADFLQSLQEHGRRRRTSLHTFT